MVSFWWYVNFTIVVALYCINDMSSHLHFHKHIFRVLFGNFPPIYIFTNTCSAFSLQTSLPSTCLQSHGQHFHCKLSSHLHVHKHMISIFTTNFPEGKPYMKGTASFWDTIHTIRRLDNDTWMVTTDVRALCTSIKDAESWRLQGSLIP